MKIAIVDDDEKCRETLVSYIERYGEQSGEKFETLIFRDGMEFASEYKADCAVAFLDVEMPLLDGISAAKRIREFDKSVAIIFVTNYSQYAINGYEVNAVDYVMKPMSYFIFENKFKKALAFSDKREKEIILTTDSDVIRVKVSSIKYISMDKNYIIYHTTVGELRVRGTMKGIRSDFAESGFASSVSGCLVNLAYVTRVTATDCYIRDDVLPLSRSMRKDFMDKYINHLRVRGGG